MTKGLLLHKRDGEFSFRNILKACHLRAINNKLFQFALEEKNDKVVRQFQTMYKPLSSTEDA